MLHALGLTGTVDGQPAWPFSLRVAVETLVIDRGLARQLALTLAEVALAALLLLLGIAWRRRRWPAWIAALALLLLAPWPAPSLVLTAALPTSFHRSPTAFDVASIDRGLALYAGHCIACHGADGRGEGPLAAALPVWPPTLSAGLMWKHGEGEIFWRVGHGMHGRDGRVTMPAFGDQLSDAELWAVLDAMKAISAGSSASREANWPWPVRAPGFSVDCAEGPAQPHARQRLRIVAAAPGVLAPLEDPRLVTLMLRPDGSAARGDGCSVSPADAAQAWNAYASVAGVPAQALAGTQFIVDRDGWLRAMSRPGADGWSDASLLCRADEPAGANATPAQDGLGTLIARMDAEPVRSPALGLPHAR